MPFQGLDPDAVDELAGRLRSQAEALDLIAQRVDGLITHAADVWGGQDSAEFAGWWYHQHRPAAGAAADAIRHLADTARSNAAQQRAASGSGNDGAATAHGPGGGRPDGGFALPGWQDVGRRARAALPWLAGADAVLAAGGILSANANVVGRYTNGWRRAQSVLGDFARYKRSPVLQALHRNPAVRALGRADDALDATPIGKLRHLGKLSLVQGAAEHLPAMHRNWREGDELGAATEAGHLVADGLKQSKNPVFYLGGMAVETWTMNVETAREIDWSEGFPNPLADGNLTKIYLPAFGDSLKSLPKSLWQIGT